MKKFETNKVYSFTKQIGVYKYIFTLKPISITKDNYLIGEVIQETYDTRSNYQHLPITQKVYTKLTTRTDIQKTKDLLVEFTTDMIV